MSNIGHNSGIAAPTEQEALDDLKRRFPELETKQAEFEDALKEYPKDLGLDDADRAAALQDLLGQIKKQKSIIKAHKKDEKGPWDRIVKVVTNLFTSAEEKLEKLEEEWVPVHQAYMDKVKAERTRKQEEEAQRQREKEEAARKAAEEAEARAAAARAEEEAAKAREAAARAAAEKAEQEKREAQARAEAAAAEERRHAEERKQRERAEKERNEDSLKAIKRHMKEAARLHDKMGEAEEGDVEQSDIDQLDALVRSGGIIGVLAGPVFDSPLLTTEQQQEIEQTRLALGNMRQVLSERLDAKVRRKRAKEAKEAEAKEAAAAEERRIQREADEARSKAAREAREKAEAETKAAEEARKKAQEESREARADARDAFKEAKVAGREVKAQEVVADRAANMADKIEDKLENATDAEIAGTLRGELGTRGSLTRNWTLSIVDEDALREVCGPLAAHFTADALNGAAYRWMRAHQSGWAGKHRVEGKDVGLPGVTFAYQQGVRIS